MKKISTLLILCLGFIVNANAQSIAPSIINSAGGFTTIAGNTYEWSIGEMVLVNTATAGNVTITQGLLQPAKSSGGSAINESQFIFDHVTVYPNPTENIFYLQADFKAKGEIHSMLYDMSGKIIQDKKISTNGQALKIPYDISALSAANYMLIVEFSAGKTSHKAAYKIEKSN